MPAVATERTAATVPVGASATTTTAATGTTGVARQGEEVVCGQVGGWAVGQA